ncbi:cytochrome P450 [Nocardia terpenica]|uniref:Cytochrome P450 n=2 Tax=Nocardia terpenica TaxID=455432 RepID=A0A6G9Z565_9NOCA|nr:cytochrome P450 [Nocardia terpenica]
MVPMSVQTVGFDDAYFRDPRAAAAALAAAGPIHRFTSSSGTEGWLVTGNELAHTVLAHPDIGKSPDAMIGGEVAANSVVGALRRAAARGITMHMLGADPPEHARLRGAVAEAFNPRAVTALTPLMRERATTLVDELDPHRPVDLIAALAFPFPMQVLFAILGLPDRHLHRIARASRTLSDVVVARPDELRAAALDFARLILPALALRQIRPRADLLTELTRQVRRRELGMREAVSTAGLLLVAGHETTTSLLASTLLHLMRQPGELARVRVDPTRLDAMIEETLRYDPPLPSTTLRQARRPLELGGQRIRPGEWIMVSLLAAHHDATAERDPDRFDADRKPNRHLAFGYGIHFCLGAQLARAEARIVLRALLARYPNPILAVPEEDLRWRQSVIFRRLQELPVLLEGWTFIS